MKSEVVSGIGILMVVLPALSIGASYADSEVWASLTDVRVGLIFVGLVLLLVARIMQRRTEGREA